LARTTTRTVIAVVAAAADLMSFIAVVDDAHAAIIEYVEEERSALLKIINK